MDEVHYNSTSGVVQLERSLLTWTAMGGIVAAKARFRSTLPVVRRRPTSWRLRFGCVPAQPTSGVRSGVSANIQVFEVATGDLLLSAGSGDWHDSFVPVGAHGGAGKILLSRA